MPETNETVVNKSGNSTDAVEATMAAVRKKEFGDGPAPPEGTKVEVETPLEYFMTALTLVAGASTVLLLNLYFQSGRGMFATYASLVAVLFFTFLASRMQTDNYFVIEKGTGDIHYHYKFLDSRTVTVYLKAAEVAAVTAGGVMWVAANNAKVWIYMIYIIDKKGRMTAFGSWKHGEEGLAAQNAEAKRLADLIGCRHIECPLMSSLSARLSGGELTVKFVERNQPLMTRLLSPSLYGYSLIGEIAFLGLLGAGAAWILFMVPHCAQIRLHIIGIFALLALVFGRRYMAG